MIFSICDTVFEFVDEIPGNHKDFIFSEWKDHEVTNIINPDVRIKYEDFCYDNFRFSISQNTKLTKEGILFFCKEGGVMVKCTEGHYDLKVSSKLNPFKLFWILERILMLTLPSKGYAIVHASSYILNDRTELTFGLQGAGKSKRLHSKLKLNADYIADDLAIVDTKGMVYYYSRRMSIHPYLTDVFSKYKNSNFKVFVKYHFFYQILNLFFDKKYTVRAKYNEMYQVGFKSKSYVKKLNCLNHENESQDFKVKFLKENSTYELISVFISDFYALKSLDHPMANKIIDHIEDRIIEKNKIIDLFVSSVGRDNNEFN